MRTATITALLAVLFAGLQLGCSKEQPKPAPTKPTPSPSTAPEVTPAPSAAPTPAATASTAVAEQDPQSLLDAVLAMIKDGKLDDADKALKALEANASSFPAAIQEKIKQARTALDAKKAISVKAPTL